MNLRERTTITEVLGIARDKPVSLAIGRNIQLHLANLFNGRKLRLLVRACTGVLRKRKKATPEKIKRSMHEILVYDKYSTKTRTNLASIANLSPPTSNRQLRFQSYLAWCIRGSNSSGGGIAVLIHQKW